MSDDFSPQRQKRRTYILDSRWQLVVFRNMAAVAVLAGLAQMGVTQLISSQDPLERMSGEQIGYLALASNLFFLAIMFGAMWIVAVRVTHSVVGPAQVIKRAVDGLVQGRFAGRITLRNRDYLTELAASVRNLSEHLKEQSEANHQLSHELEVAVNAGNAARALELARSLRSSESNAQEGDEKCAA